MNTLRRNDCFAVDGSLYRCISVDSLVVYVIDLDDEHAQPQRWGRRFVDALVTSDLLTFMPPEARSIRPLLDGRSDLHRCHERFRRIRELIRKPELLDKETRGSSIRAHALASGVSERALLDLMRRWWQGGQTMAALADTHHPCGFRLARDAELEER